MNEIIKEIADDFLRTSYHTHIDGDEFANESLLKSYELNNDKDRLVFFNIVKSHVKVAFDKHYETCKKDNCSIAKAYRLSNYHIDNSINELAIEDSENAFDYEEEAINNEKLDQIISELSKLRTGQELIYDDLINEIEELKELYHLGKKTWGQILKGKALEMFLKGVANELIIKQLIELVEDDVSRLIN